MNNTNEKEIYDIYLDDIIPNRFQPRLTFDERSLNELADSIKQHGIIQPLVVRKLGDKYEIIAGERRYKAAQIAGLQKVPAVIMSLDDKESAEVAVVENIQRRDLSALEEAESYKKLLDKNYLTQEQLATRMGKTQATISNKLRLLGLDEEVKTALLNEKISERHARSLLSLKDPIQQREVLNKIVNNKLTVRQTDELIKSMTTNDQIETLSFGEPISIEDNTTPVVNNQSDTPTTVVENKVSDFKPSLFFDIPDIAIQTTDEPISNTVDNQLPNEENQKENPDQFKFGAISNIDVNKVKAEAEDINKTVPLADMDTLLGGNPTIKKEEAAKDPVDEMPSFKFINPILDDDEDNDEKVSSDLLSNFENVNSTIKNSNIPEPKTYTDSLVQEYRQSNGATANQNEIVPGNLRSAVNAVMNITKNIEKNNFKVDVEEFDFEHLYQIIIKIEK